MWVAEMNLLRVVKSTAMGVCNIKTISHLFSFGNRERDPAILFDLYNCVGTNIAAW